MFALANESEMQIEDAGALIKQFCLVGVRNGAVGFLRTLQLFTQTLIKSNLIFDFRSNKN